MSPKASELLRQALNLDEVDRASLAGALVESLESATDSNATEEWQAVVQRRVQELESGAVESVGWTEVRERLFRGFE